MRRTIVAIVLCVALLCGAGLRYANSEQPAASPLHAPGQILNLRFAAPSAQEKSLAWLRENWQDNYAPMLIESLRYIRSPSTRRGTADLLDAKTPEKHGLDIDAWYHWLWEMDYRPHPGYAEFKTALYAKLDPRFAPYFSDTEDARIRLDEIRWGGVRQNGIPPLRQPNMLAADKAEYLADDHVVFAVDLNGDARAYPKRIMGHHEMFIDEIGGIDVTGVYCTLCGSMIIYESAGHALGTSGFLYRSNKLMFDEKTNSLWSTLLGYPVVGPLVGKDIVLRRHPVVTTTWGQWRERHPETTVVDINTGFNRNYGESVAYHDYFASDDLMFAIPEQFKDDILPNKAEILALRAGDDALAISADFLRENQVYQDSLDGENIVVITDDSGANRVYAARDFEFSARPEPYIVADDNGRRWSVTENFIVGSNNEKLPRVPAHRAFWFGWKAAVNNTRLVK